MMLEKLESKVSRRKFLIGAGKAGAALAVVSVLGSCIEADKDEVTEAWLKLEKRFENEPVDFETFKNVVVPLTAQTYVAYSATSLTPKEIINSIKLSQISRYYILPELFLPFDVTDPRNAHLVGSPIFGSLNLEKRMLDLYFNTYPQPAKRKWGSHYEFVSHLTILRSGLFHEFVHFNTETRSPSAIKDKDLVDFPPGETLDLGFRAIWDDPKTPNLGDADVLRTLDEEITDLLACHISSKAGLEYSAGWEKGRNLEKLFSAINLPLDELLKIHRQSDIVGFATLLAEKSLGTFDEDQKLVFGLQIIGEILRNNWDRIEELFPGFHQQENGIFVCRP